EALLAGVENAGGDQPQRVVLVAETHGVAGVVAPLIAGNDVKRLAQQVDDLSLTFVAPLRTNYGEILPLWHRRRGRLTHCGVARGSLHLHWAVISQDYNRSHEHRQCTESHSGRRVHRPAAPAVRGSDYQAGDVRVPRLVRDRAEGSREVQALAA